MKVSSSTVTSLILSIILDTALVKFSYVEAKTTPFLLLGSLPILKFSKDIALLKAVLSGITK